MKNFIALLFLLPSLKLFAETGDVTLLTLFGVPLEFLVIGFFAIIFLVVIALVIEPAED